MGVHVCPLPTAVLSTHTGGFTDYSIRDLTAFMEECILHWNRLGIVFDAVYSGFLGSPKQMDLVAAFIAAQSDDDPLVVNDPVMGDKGSTYGPISGEKATRMPQYIHHADIITTNLTEAAFLLDEPDREDAGEHEVMDWILRLSDMGPGTVIVTSAPDPSSKKRTSVLACDRADGRYWKVACDYIPANCPGTGDAFASVVVGSIMQGDIRARPSCEGGGLSRTGA